MNATASFRTLDDWLPWLETLSPREIVLGLERVSDVLNRLEIRRPELTVTISGTNGKGSSLALLEAILREQGVRTGAYSSPHVHRYNERTRIDGEPVGDGDIVAALQAVEAVRGDIPLTFFEFGTLASLVAFDKAGVEAWLLEVGMGGRLDAVNAVDSDASLITNVSLDHCSWLGDDVESIATEKAGIMRPGKPVVFGSGDVPRAIVRRAGEVGATLLLAGRDFEFSVADDGSWSWRGQRTELDDLPRPALAGNIQFRNASAVLALVEALDAGRFLDRSRVRSALTKARLDGRCQQLGQHWILDVAHNPAAAAVLAGFLQTVDNGGNVTAIIGMLGDKDVAGFVMPLEPLVDRFVAVATGSSRGAPAEATAQRIANATGRPCRVIPALEDALESTAARLGAADRVLVAGSFYIVGPALRWIEQYESLSGAAGSAN